METNNLYRPYSEFLIHKYGEKVYKLPINLDVTCPNRDGTVGVDGCYFCSDLGTGYESLSSQNSVKDQLLQNMAYIGNKYHAKKFVAYFQNYTNTHMPIDVFEQWMLEACVDQVVELAVSTRPDCISEAYLEVLKQIHEEKGIEITIELGLQTTNEESLVKVNRGHTVKDYVKAVECIRKYPFEICTHLILNLPWDTDADVLNIAKLMNKLQMNQIKLHALYIAKNTVFEKMYLNKDIHICTKEAYIQKVILFLEHLNDTVIVQRLIGRAPKEVTTFCNWDTSWWKIRDEIQTKMVEQKTFQGKYSKAFPS